MQALELGVWDMRPRLARVSQWPWACDLPSTSPSVFIGRRGIRAALAQRLLSQGFWAAGGLHYRQQAHQLWGESPTPHPRQVSCPRAIQVRLQPMSLCPFLQLSCSFNDHTLSTSYIRHPAVNQTEHDADISVWGGWQWANNWGLQIEMSVDEENKKGQEAESHYVWEGEGELL